MSEFAKSSSSETYLKPNCWQSSSFRKSVVSDNIHIKAIGDFYHMAADTAGADNADGFSGKIKAP